MATLSAQDRLDGAGEYMRELVLGTLSGCVKADVRAAYNALDQFLSDNAVAINNTLPATFKANATQTQKAILLMYVITKRYLKGA